MKTREELIRNYRLIARREAESIKESGRDREEIKKMLKRLHAAVRADIIQIKKRDA